MYVFLKIIAALPLSVLHALASLVALLLNLFPNQSMRWIVRVNLWLAYPDLPMAQRLQLEKDNVRSQCMTAVESIKSWGMPPAYSLAQIRQVIGQDVFLQALQNPSGVIAVVPHFGTWEIMNFWLGQYTQPIIMYKPSKDAGVDRFMLEARQRMDATLVPADESGVRAVFKALKRGGFTAILPDQVPDTAGGIFSPFFGHEVLTSTLVSRLAQKTGCSVIGLSCIRNNNNVSFDIICEALTPDIASKDLQVAVDSLNAEMQRMISRAPEQYVWAYKRFKRMQNKQLENIYNVAKLPF